MADAKRAADAVAERLFAAGCRHAFGMPGGEVLTLVDALEKAGIAFHLCKHENAAGFMAEGAHHMDGAPAILVATVGPGLMNGVNVIANADQDRVPLIVLTGCVDADEALSYTHQVLDHRAVLTPITRATFTLSARGAATIADKAVAQAMAPRQGPVLIDVPISVADAAVPAGTPAPAARPPAAVAPVGPALDEARAWLSAAERPLMVVGLDVLRDGAADDVRALAERFAMPVVTTYKAKGVLPENHALALGGAGLSPLADKHLMPLLAQADLILCLGYDPIEMRPGWRDPWDPDRQRVIDVTAVANTHYMHQATVNFVADTGAAARALAKATPRATWPGKEPAATRTTLCHAFPTDDPWGPAAVIDECRQVLPPHTLASVDSGAHRILLSQMWTCDRPRALIQSSGLCTMGCAVPLAMGAALARPDRPAVAFVGDGGFLMACGDLSTAQELGLPVIIVVFVDASLALIELKQRQRQLRNAGVDFGRHDFAAIGRAFGGAGVTVTDRSELRGALVDALAMDHFTVIAAQIDRGGYDGRI
ncbi:MAG: thiamine pyrophosphate-binding protein [Pseudomonadota bacterium]